MELLYFRFWNKVIASVTDCPSDRLRSLKHIIMVSANLTCQMYLQGAYFPTGEPAEHREQHLGGERERAVSNPLALRQYLVWFINQYFVVF